MRSHPLHQTLFLVVALLFGGLGSLLCGGELRVAKYVPSGGGTLHAGYPEALSGLLATARNVTGLPLAEEPLQVESFGDPRLAGCPVLYLNWMDREDWSGLPESEILSLRAFLESGGFLHIDSGIVAEFLRREGVQNHSYGEWEASPECCAFLERVLPGHPFQVLGRDDPVFRVFYQGLPSTELLPDSVRQYTVEEKWPSGTYSAVGIRLDGRLAVLATPVLAMGWGRDAFGGWTTEIRMRVLEGGTGLDTLLPDAAVLGPQYSVRREDGGTDQVFCQDRELPAWLREPSGRWRVFRYYDSNQISDFTHLFYSRLGVNFLLCALLGE